MHIVVVGLNHKVAPVEVREELSFPRASLAEALTRLRTADGSCAHVAEGVILSTCNRLEVYTVASSKVEGEDAVCSFLESCHGKSREAFRLYLYTYVDEEAVRHLFSVAAGLDSMVLGESEILGQVTEALEKGIESGAAGGILTALFRKAIETGKRARTETGISRGVTSVSHVAVGLAQNIFGDLSACQVVLVGAGEMVELAARAMVTCGVENLSILNRTRERAEQLAAEFGARALGWDQLDNALWWADIVLTSTGAPHTIFHPDNLRPALEMRRGRPLFFIDIAVPRNVDPQVRKLENVYLYDIDDLESVVETSMQQRWREIPKVNGIVANQLDEFIAWLRSLDVVPTIVALRQKAENIRQAELESTLRCLNGLSKREQSIVQAMTKRMINKLLHEPTIRLKERTNGRDGYMYAAVVRDLFDLDGRGRQSG